MESFLARDHRWFHRNRRIGPRRSVCGRNCRGHWLLRIAFDAVERSDSAAAGAAPNVAEPTSASSRSSAGSRLINLHTQWIWQAGAQSGQFLSCLAGNPRLCLGRSTDPGRLMPDCVAVDPFAARAVPVCNRRVPCGWRCRHASAGLRPQGRVSSQTRVAMPRSRFRLRGRSGRCARADSAADHRGLSGLPSC